MLEHRQNLYLDCLTLSDVGPVALIEAAASAGFVGVSLCVQPPTLFPKMLMTADTIEEVRRAIADTGVQVGNLEVFNLNGDGAISEYEPNIALGASLGAKYATAINYGEARADIPERLAEFQSLASRYGLSVLIEPLSMGATRTLHEGIDLIQASGVEARLVVDFVHLVRAGGDVATLRGIDPKYLGYVQICDGPNALQSYEIMTEATENRLYPGEGDFPLRDFLDAVPTHAVLGVEVPSLTRANAGMSPLERARLAYADTLRLLERLDG